MMRYNYKDTLGWNYQIAEMKEETNETDMSMDRSACSDFQSRNRKSQLKQINVEETTKRSAPPPQQPPTPQQEQEQHNPFSSQHLVRQPTTQSIYQPLMFKSGYSINYNANTNTDNILPDDLIVSKTYSKFNSLKSPMITSLQQHNNLRKQVLQRDGAYSVENPELLQYQLNQQQQQPYNHSYSLDNNKITSFQSQINDLKSRNQELEKTVANQKKDLSDFDFEKKKNKALEEKLKELQWKLDRQRNQPLPTLKKVMNSDEDIIQEISNINLKQENRTLKERVSSLEYDLKLAVSQSSSQKYKQNQQPPSLLEIENRKLLCLIEELQRQITDVTDKLGFYQTFKEKYQNLQAENQNLKQAMKEDQEPSKFFGCFC